jgi:hypothetical protein
LFRRWIWWSFRWRGVLGASTPVADLLFQHGTRGAVLATAHGLGAEQCSVGEVHDQGRLATSPGTGGRSAVGRVEEIEGRLRVGEDSDRHRAAYVERLGDPALSEGINQRGGDLGQRVVEVLEAPSVCSERHLRYPGVVDRGLVQDRVTGVEGLELLEFAFFGIQPEHGLVEQPVRGDRTNPVGDRLDHQVDVGGGIGRVPDRPFGDPAGPPHLDVTDQDPGPDAG